MNNQYVTRIKPIHQSCYQLIIVCIIVHIYKRLKHNPNIENRKGRAKQWI